MKATRFVIWMSLTTSGICIAGAPFVSKAGGFAVAFPAQPEQETTAAGPLQIHTARVLDEKRNGVYTAMFTDYPDEADAAARLRAIADGTLGPRKKLGERKISLGKVPGLEVRAAWENEAHQELVETFRCYLDGQRAFQVSVVTTPRGGVPEAEVKAFLDSFKLAARSSK